MPGKGVRSATPSPVAVGAARLLFTMAAWSLAVIPPAGCHSLRGKNKAVVRVESKRNPTKAARLTRLGIGALEKQHIDHAADCFRKAVDADNRFGPAHNNLGLLHYEQGNLYQAAVAFQQARRWMPDDPAVLYNLALTLESAGRTDEALSFYYRANELDPVNPNYLGNLVRLRLRLGERDDLLRQQLRDLVLIETRPQWRRWADRQLALTVNVTLDRGPATPDFSDPVSAAGSDDASDANRLREKIIDLTPVVPVSAETPDPLQQHFEQLPDAPAKPDESANSDLESVDPMELAPPRVRTREGADSNEPSSVLIEGDAMELPAASDAPLEEYFRR